MYIQRMHRQSDPRSLQCLILPICLAGEFESKCTVVSVHNPEQFVALCVWMDLPVNPLQTDPLQTDPLQTTALPVDLRHNCVDI